MYSEIEEAVRQVIVKQVPGITDSLCVISDIDALFEAMNTAGANLGFLLDYEDGRRASDAPFNGKMWAWWIRGTVMIRYEGDSTQIEKEAREAIDSVYALFDLDYTLGGKSAITRVLTIDKPVTGFLNDVPFYWIPFLVEAMERI